MSAVEPQRGDVVLVDFESFAGSIHKVRPAVVVSIDLMNRHALHVTVAPVRAAAGKRLLPVHVAVASGEGGLTKDSLVDVGHVATVDKRRLIRRLGGLGPDSRLRLDAAIRFYFGV